jgi:uncharacterized repeat protein (TIGR01451 family)/uncharacterized repeat protein (TIGR02543 family)
MSMTSFPSLPRLTQKLATLVQAVWYGLFVSLVIGSWPQTVLAQLSCTITQITNAQTFSEVPTISADGTRITFGSGADLTGGNPDGNEEIFLYNTSTGTFTQITSTTAGQSSTPTINADGTRIAFQSTANLTGGNADGNIELFLFDTTTNTLSQITNTTGAVHTFVPIAINADGTRIAFQSTANLTGGNADGNIELFLFDTTTGTFTQITNASGAFSGSPSINADGTRITFSSGADLTGSNPDGNREIFLYNTSTGTFTQITNASGAFSGSPSINADGTRIAFQSTANLTGSNPDGNPELFLYNTSTGTFTQITSTTAGGSFEVAISANGTRIASESRANLTGGNPDGNEEIFLYDTTTDTLIQITSSTASTSSSPSINANGTLIAFDSTANLTGGNPDGNFEIFLATCGAGLSADLALTKTDAPDPVLAGQNLTYTLTVTNNGPSTAANAVLDDTIQAPTTFQSLTAPAGWTCTTPAVGSTGMVHCSTASLAASATASFTLVVKVPGSAAGTTLSNTATTFSATADPNAANNSATATTPVTSQKQALTLTVMVAGQGGTVTITPPGTTCQGTCKTTYTSGTQVTLTATAAAGYRFTGWTGACTGTINPCTVTVNTDLTVKASFKK